MESTNIFSVTQYNARIQQQICKDLSLFNVYVEGEISGFKVSGAHAYFTLKDKDSNLSVSYFNFAMSYIPKDGEKVILFGSPNYYPKNGKFSFKCKQIAPQGIGDLHIQLEQLKQRLKEEGLFDEEHKKPLPYLPKTVAVVTSRTGAVIRDIITTIRKQNDYVTIKLINVKVQGVGAEQDIEQGLILADSINADLIILARGGGSFEDLYPFNTERVARAVYNVKTPIISAVGHETDISLSDLTADYRAPTPTAAAEIVAVSQQGIIQYVLDCLSRMEALAISKYQSNKNRVALVVERLLASIKNRSQKQISDVFALLSEMRHAIDNKQTAQESRINSLVAVLSQQNPARILQKGYARVQKENEVISDVSQLKPNDSVSIVFGNGEAQASIVSVSKNTVGGLYGN